MKKTFYLGTIICLLFMTVSCNKTPNENEKTKLTFFHWTVAQSEMFDEMIAEFEKENPNIEVEAQVAPWGEYWTKLEASLANGNASDVFMLHTVFAELYTANNMVLPLENLTDIDPTFSYDNYFKDITNLYNFNGVQYGLPKDIDNIILIYNKELFDMAEVDYPSNTWTWDDLTNAAVKISALGDDIYGFGAQDHIQVGWPSFIYQNGGYVISPDGTNAGMGSKEAIEAIKWYTDMFLNSNISPDVSVFAETAPLNYFAQGKLGMGVTGSWKLNQLVNNEDIKDKFDIAELPMGKRKATISNGVAYSISKSTKNAEAAKKLITFFVSDKGSEIAAKNAAVPAHKSYVDMWVDNHKNDYNASVIVDSIKFGYQLPGSLKRPQWEPYMLEIMSKIFLGEVGVEEGMTQIQEEMDAIIN